MKQHKNLSLFCVFGLSRFIFILVVNVGVCFILSTADILEQDRIKEYYKRNYTYPLPNDQFVPNTAGWISIMRQRLTQVEQVSNRLDRYHSFLHSMAQIMVPNFTRTGWGLYRAPPKAVKLLQESLHQGLSNNNNDINNNNNDNNNQLKYETPQVGEIDGPLRPWKIEQDELNQIVLKELQPIHEAWSNTLLQGKMAYGLRVYRNQSVLHMHVDRVGSHVISCILHVDHSNDSKPWPLIIEDYTGHTNEIYMAPGDLLFYESSKCLHGRPKPLYGSWYSSIFVHYAPVGWNGTDMELKLHYAIPPHWLHPVRPDKNNKVPPLMRRGGGGFVEPTCPYKWCNLQNPDKIVKWNSSKLNEHKDDDIVLTASFANKNGTGYAYKLNYKYTTDEL